LIHHYLLKITHMKKLSVVIIAILMAISGVRSLAQEIINAASIPPYRLQVTFGKTTNLVFPYAIKSVDRGSRDILVQKAIGVENILQVKAAKMGFAETDLTVVTADGGLYSYVLNYTDSPANLSYEFNNVGVHPRPAAVFAKDATTDEVQQNAILVQNKERTVKGPKDESFDILIDVKGIYIHNNVLYFQLLLKNSSPVNYDVQSLRFFIRDKKRVKRTAEQEIDMQPVFIAGNTDAIENKSEQTVAIALPKFTIPDKKYLQVQMMEKNGGRNLSLRIKNKTLITAGTL